MVDAKSNPSALVFGHDAEVGQSDDQRGCYNPQVGFLKENVVRATVTDME